MLFNSERKEMNISRSNYEIWFIDYADGKLSVGRQELLFKFLDVNPDLKEEFDLFISVDLPVESVSIAFPGKDQLRKSDLIIISTEELISYLEGDADEVLKAKIATELNHNKKLIEEFRTLKLTRAVPDSKIVFPSKKRLKKGLILSISPAVQRTLAVAASLVVIFTIYSLYKSSITVRENNTVENSLPESPKPNINTDLKENIVFPVSPDQAGLTGKKSERHRSKQSPEKIPESAFAQQNSSMQNRLVTEQPAPVQSEQLVTAEKRESAAQPDLSIPSAKISVNIKPTRVQLTEIFTTDDLAEFSETPDTPEKTTTALLQLAQKGVQKIGEKADITFEEEINAADNSKTFALAVGKKFAIRYTSGR
jgi:hypothetical protein